MGYSKRQFIEMAFEELGLSGHGFDLQPEQYQTGLKRLDAMMSTWNSRGLRLSYPIPAEPENSDLDEETSVPDKANEAVYLNLATRLASSFGKVISVDLRNQANAMYNDLIRSEVGVTEVELQVVPMGAGNKNYGTSLRFIVPSDADIQVGNDASLEFN